MNASNLRTISIIVAFIIGVCFPQLGALNWLIRWLVVIMLFVTFLGVRVTGLRPEWKHIILVSANLFFGLAPYFLLKSMGWEDLALGAFFTAIAPTATSAAVVMGFLGGRVEFMITAMLATSGVICGLMPILLPLVIPGAAGDIILNVAANIAFLLIVPMVPALIVRRIHPHSFKWAAKLKDVSFGAWVLALVLISAHAAEDIASKDSLGWMNVCGVMAVSLVLCILNFGVGYIIGWPSRKRECSQALGQKNTVLTIFLAMTYANPLAALGPTFYVLWHNLWNAIQLSRKR